MYQQLTDRRRVSMVAADGRVWVRNGYGRWRLPCAEATSLATWLQAPTRRTWRGRDEYGRRMRAHRLRQGRIGLVGPDTSWLELHADDVRILTVVVS